MTVFFSTVTSIIIHQWTQSTALSIAPHYAPALYNCPQTARQSMKGDSQEPACCQKGFSSLIRSMAGVVRCCVTWLRNPISSSIKARQEGKTKQGSKFLNRHIDPPSGFKQNIQTALLILSSSHLGPAKKNTTNNPCNQPLAKLLLATILKNYQLNIFDEKLILT